MKEFRRYLWLLAGATVLLYLAGASFAGYVFSQERTTAHALCTFRADLQQRVTSSREFLKTHPNGIPGISAAQIQSSINNQQRTIDSLSDLSCS